MKGLWAFKNQYKKKNKIKSINQKKKEASNSYNEKDYIQFTSTYEQFHDIILFYFSKFLFQIPALQIPSISFQDSLIKQELDLIFYYFWNSSYNLNKITMYQSQQSNGRFSGSEQADPTLSHAVDMICLSILFVGFFSCLIRSDYNFAVIFFCYFVWQQRKDALALKIVMAATILLIVFDLIFVFTEVRVWVTEDPKNPIWQTLRPMHNFGIFCWVVLMILKIVLAVFVGKGISNVGKAVQNY